jgi:hypothetical protein
VPTAEVQAQKPMDPGIGRKGMREDGETEPVLTQHGQPVQEGVTDE